MIAFPEILAGCASEAGILIPEDFIEYDREKYPHWDIYLKIQLGAPMPSSTAHWANAEVIAGVADEDIKKVTYKQLLELGLAVGHR